MRFNPGKVRLMLTNHLSEILYSLIFVFCRSSECMTFWKRRSISVKLKTLKSSTLISMWSLFCWKLFWIFKRIRIYLVHACAAVSWHDRSAYYFTLDFNVSTYKSLNWHTRKWSIPPCWLWGDGFNVWNGWVDGLVADQKSQTPTNPL